MNNNPFYPHLLENGIIVLDGGLSIELEKQGYNLNHPLWSAEILRKNPEAIRKAHLSYLHAGAKCIITSSYQISFPGCRYLGMSEEETIKLLKLSSSMANEAIEIFMDESNCILKPIIASSIGPYGAYLADGSEYRGEYGVSADVLYDFHIKRWQILNDTRIDLFACETIPNAVEAKVLLGILQSTSDRQAYFSFSCKDGMHINDGTPIREIVNLFTNVDQVAAIGINCTSPQFISSLINEIKSVNSSSLIIIYPNSGEEYDSASKKWNKHNTLNINQIREWKELGASIIGGCCRVGSTDISNISRLLKN